MLIWASTRLRPAAHNHLFAGDYKRNISDIFQRKFCRTTCRLHPQRQRHDRRSRRRVIPRISLCRCQIARRKLIGQRKHPRSATVSSPRWNARRHGGLRNHIREEIVSRRRMAGHELQSAQRSTSSFSQPDAVISVRATNSRSWTTAIFVGGGTHPGSGLRQFMNRAGLRRTQSRASRREIRFQKHPGLTCPA